MNFEGMKMRNYCFNEIKLVIKFVSAMGINSLTLRDIEKKYFLNNIGSYMLNILQYSKLDLCFQSSNKINCI